MTRRKPKSNNPPKKAWQEPYRKRPFPADSNHPSARPEPPVAVIEERARAYAATPRNLMLDALGDPPPGRSALDRRLRPQSDVVIPLFPVVRS